MCDSLLWETTKWSPDLELWPHAGYILYILKTPAFLHLSVWSQVLHKCCSFLKDPLQVCEMGGPKEMLLKDSLYRLKL